MKLYPSIPPNLATWAARQPFFLTASAPTHAPHVNVSPKGLAASHLAFLDANTVAYIDRSGSGCETIAHAYENGRLTLMFMSFGTLPRILRLFCNAEVIERGTPRFEEWMARVVQDREGGGMEGARAVIVGRVWEVQTSCGFGVPIVKKEVYERGAEGDDSDEEGGKELSIFQDRHTLDDYWRKRAENGKVEEYQVEKNVTSIDGLPALKAARREAGEVLILAEGRAKLGRAVRERDGILLGVLLSLLVWSFTAIVFGKS
ncbi:hypothetical protein VdG1_02045 [Verticillium dahliae VDG1]|nr:hypothetical protein VdG1_02045 [Verticillium dahliae VDG1]